MLRLAPLLLCLLPLLVQAAGDWDRVPQQALSVPELERLRAAQPPPSRRGPAHLAIAVPMPLGLEDGLWTTDGDTAVWRLRLTSAGAGLLIPVFDRYDLPPGAELRISDAEGRVVQGPYTAADRNADGELWSAMVPGPEARLELRVPAVHREAVVLHLGRLGHGVAGRDAGTVPAKSGSCNIDAVCPAGNGWRNEIRSAVVIQYPVSASSISACSGQLVNTTAQDGSPYVLTAHHCGISQTRATGTVFYFNYQTTVCGGPRNGSLAQNVRGADLLFSHPRSDHSLLRLRARPPLSFNAHYAGFNASASALPQSGRAIHHAQGFDDDFGRLDEKRISVYSQPGIKTSIDLEGTTVDAFRIRWADGITETGSSGGGLWNENHELVGVLSGGSTSCLNPDGNDFFGRLELAWTAGLRSYLDPAGTGSTRIAGRNAAASDTGDAGNEAAPASRGGGGSFGGAGLLALVGLAGLLIRRRRAWLKACP